MGFLLIGLRAARQRQKATTHAEEFTVEPRTDAAGFSVFLSTRTQPMTTLPIGSEAAIHCLCVNGE